MAEFSFDVEHRPGLKHNEADALSRVPCRQCGRSEELGKLMRSVEDCRAVATETKQNTTENYDKFGPEALHQAQLADPILRPVLAWLQDHQTHRQLMHFVLRVVRQRHTLHNGHN